MKKHQMFNNNRQHEVTFPYRVKPEKYDMTEVQEGMTPEQMATVISNKLIDYLKKELKKPQEKHTELAK